MPWNEGYNTALNTECGAFSTALNAERKNQFKWK